MNHNITHFTARGDERGWLIAIEEGREVPFTIKRVYYIFGTVPGVRRGKHAHKKLRQLAICIQGSCDFFMDNGKVQETISLCSRSAGLLIEPMVWHEMDNFSPDCVLLVLASDLYRESDYIRSWSEFESRLSGENVL